MATCGYHRTEEQVPIAFLGVKKAVGPIEFQTGDKLTIPDRKKSTEQGKLSAEVLCFTALNCQRKETRGIREGASRDWPDEASVECLE